MRCDQYFAVLTVKNDVEKTILMFFFKTLNVPPSSEKLIYKHG